MATTKSDSNNRVAGIVEILANGRGYLRDCHRDCQARSDDPVVPIDMVRRLGLRGGEILEGRRGRRNKRDRTVPPQVVDVETIDGMVPAERAKARAFDQLTAINPDKHLTFETPGGPMAMRVMDLVTPIGRGQRGLIVAPPRTGKTTLLHQIADAMAANWPETELIILLIDERPEEVTEMRRTIKGQVFASSKDHDTDSHVRLARIVIARAKRMVEMGKDVCLLLDSVTRMGRAFNASVGSSGRTMTGGVDIRAMEEPKRIFGAARNVEEGGSLTIIASALIETGSRADEFIFQEFKGTGNMELMLSRELANLRIWPAMDLNQSGTRKEELLLGPERAELSHRLRRVLSTLDPKAQMETLLQALGRFKTNAEFVANCPI